MEKGVQVLGVKHDQGKPRVGLVLGDFARALIAVAEVGTYGLKKYPDGGGWKNVPDAAARYEDAHGRHDLSMKIEECDPESGLAHAAHRAWNALAVLELMLIDRDRQAAVGATEGEFGEFTDAFEAEIRAAINPKYQNVKGTESHERRILLGEIDRLRALIESEGM